ncbi:hypothetical protein MUK42_02539 [Musa troglodytarum]|uniref:Uncharacterized protein n=1 Tax=Musa troglodytarum TaxID=320322 RepID=A0A9E7EYK8_9LILI|nr:hypothetical protein MUK42_02539 [Musa troglodytarum]
MAISRIDGEGISVADRLDRGEVPVPRGGVENGRFAAPLRESVLPPRCRSGVSHLRAVCRRGASRDEGSGDAHLIKGQEVGSMGRDKAHKWRDLLQMKITWLVTIGCAVPRDIGSSWALHPHLSYFD